MFRKLFIYLGFLPEKPDVDPRLQEKIREQKEAMRKSEYLVKEKIRKDEEREKEKEKWKSYFRNVIEGYEKETHRKKTIQHEKQLPKRAPLHGSAINITRVVGTLQEIEKEYKAKKRFADMMNK